MRGQPEAGRTIQVPFLAAVALAGLSYLVAARVVARSEALRRARIPAPLLGGFAAALALLLLRLAGLALEVPSSGYEVDFLVGLLTANMGLHVTPSVLRKGLPVFLLFPLYAALLFVALLFVALPIALLTDAPLASAVLAGPIALAGAPFNLNPPQQVPPIAGLLEPAVERPDRVAKGLMMLGVAAALVLPGWFERRMERASGVHPRKPSPDEKPMERDVWDAARHLAALVIGVLAIVSVAFGIQALLRRTFPGFEQPYLPVIVIAYLLGIATRLTWSALPGAAPFPKRELNVLLFGPTMGIVLTYAVLAIPLHDVLAVPPVLFAITAAGVAVSVAGAWIAHRAFARLLSPHESVVAATVLLAITTGWGPMAMAYLRRITVEDGPAKPIPIVLPLNAFYLFPWTMIWMTRATFALVGA